MANMVKPEARVEFDTNKLELPNPAVAVGVRCVQKNTFLHFEEDSPINRRPRSKSDVTSLRSGYQEEELRETEEEELREGSTVDEDSPRGRQSRLGSLDDWQGHETPQFTAVVGGAVVGYAPPPINLPSAVHVLAADPAADPAAAVPRKTKKDAVRRADVTLMLRNIPNKYTQEVLLEELARYLSTIDFFYLPIDFRNQCNLGYAFLNFKDGSAAMDFQALYDGNRLERFPQSPKVLQVHMARVQGLQANVKRLRNSSVMGMLTEDCKPVLFEGGEMKPLGHREQPSSRRGRRAR
jgi:hypothetical protein